MTVLGGDPGDTVGVPDVGVDFAFDEFEFVELGDFGDAVFDSYLPGFLEAFGVPEAERSGAVAGD